MGSTNAAENIAGSVAPVLKAPFPWFGGKRKAAGAVWARFGDVKNYVEPFFGSGAVLLGRPSPRGTETVNDLDGFVANFWRALQHNPEEVADYADNPVNENDLHARHAWLLSQRETLRAALEGNPDFYDVRIAGYWVWGVCCWIGSGFCSGGGPWSVNEAGHLVRGEGGRGIPRTMPHLGNAGRGIKRQLPHLGNAGRGLNRKLPHLGTTGRGIKRQHQAPLLTYFLELHARLRNVRVASGDWSRVCGPSVTTKLGITGVFLDPPYAKTTGRTTDDLYREDDTTCSQAVREWAIANGDNTKMRIALCGYEGEHHMPDSWSVVCWNAGAGFGGQAKEQTSRGRRERIWFSPGCLQP
jgi:DNA adenine methylase